MTAFTDWTAEMNCSMGPDQPPSSSKGTESVRSLGGLWTLGEGQGDVRAGEHDEGAKAEHDEGELQARAFPLVVDVAEQGEHEQEEMRDARRRGVRNVEHQAEHGNDDEEGGLREQKGG